jgi:membrane-associated protein
MAGSASIGGGRNENGEHDDNATPSMDESRTTTILGLRPWLGSEVLLMDPGTIAESAWIQAALGLVSAYGYPFLLLVSIVENVVVVGLLVPGDAIAVLGGAACASRILALAPTYAAVACGVTLGSVLSYAIGVRGGMALVGRWGERVGLTRARLDSAQQYFDRHGSKTVFVGCFLSGLKNLVPAIAGASRMSFGRFFAYTLTATGLRTAGLVAVGYVFARALDRALLVVREVNLWVGVVTAVAFAFWLGFVLLRRRTRRKGGGKGASPDRGT